MTLAELCRRLTSTNPLEEAVTYAVEEVGRLLEADAVTYWILTAPSRIQLRVADRWPGRIDGSILHIAPDSQARYILRSPDAVESGVADESRFVPSSAIRRKGFARSVSMRLWSDGQARGLIAVHRREDRPFDSADQLFLETVAGALSLAVDRADSQEDLAFRATHDSLTGLANRDALLAVLDDAVKERTNTAALLIDLDGFKAVNDAYGHTTGDSVLQRVGRRLSRAVRGDDVVGRLGGDEFVVVSRDCDPGSLRDLAERLLGAVEQLISLGPQTFTVSASVGVAHVEGFASGADVLAAADAAMYRAKARGRGRVEHAAPPDADSNGGSVAGHVPPVDDDRSASVTPVMVGEAIAAATVAFQPIVGPDGTTIVGVEALARGPVDGPFASPASLFAHAEAVDRVADLEVAIKGKAFNAGVPDELTLFLNVDPEVLTDDDARHRLIDVWKSSPFTGQVVIELTERSLVASPGRLLRAIRHCRDIGWQIALDDLGARAETLTALRLVRPDVAKLDLSLVSSAKRFHAASVSVAVSSYRERDDLIVVAEGVETEAHVATAIDLGANLLQGYHFGRPGPLPDLLQAVEDGRMTICDSPTRAQLQVHDGAWRTATKRHLLEVTRVIEAMSWGPESIVLAALQSVEHYTPRTRRQYTALARRSGMVGVIGVGIQPGVVNGVHHAPVPVNDDMERMWLVVVLTAHGGLTLEAIDVGDGDGGDLDRLFRYRVSRNVDTVEGLAQRILAYF